MRAARYAPNIADREDLARRRRHLNIARQAARRLLSLPVYPFEHRKA